MDSSILRGPDGECRWIEAPDGWWVEVEGLEPRAMTAYLLARKARWVSMTFSPLADGASRLTYRWHVAGRPLNIVTAVSGRRVDSVADLLPAAAATERELHERFAIEFAAA